MRLVCNFYVVSGDLFSKCGLFISTQSRVGNVCLNLPSCLLSAKREEMVCGMRDDQKVDEAVLVVRYPRRPGEVCWWCLSKWSGFCTKKAGDCGEEC